MVDAQTLEVIPTMKPRVRVAASELTKPSVMAERANLERSGIEGKR